MRCTRYLLTNVIKLHSRSRKGKILLLIGPSIETFPIKSHQNNDPLLPLLSQKPYDIQIHKHHDEQDLVAGLLQAVEDVNVKGIILDPGYLAKNSRILKPTLANILSTQNRPRIQQVIPHATEPSDLTHLCPDGSIENFGVEGYKIAVGRVIEKWSEGTTREEEDGGLTSSKEDKGEDAADGLWAWISEQISTQAPTATSAPSSPSILDRPKHDTLLANHSTQEHASPSSPHTSPAENPIRNRRLFVRNFPLDTHWKDLEFQEAGNVEKVAIKDSSLGYAFVRMSTVKETKDAVRLLNGREFRGRAIEVKPRIANNEGPESGIAFEALSTMDSTQTPSTSTPAPRNESKTDSYPPTQSPQTPSPPPLATPRTPRDPGCRLFIKSLPITTRTGDIQSLFRKAGKVRRANVKQSGNRRFGYVTMGTIKQARDAIKLLNGREFKGTIIEVKPYKPLDDDAIKSPTQTASTAASPSGKVESAAGSECRSTISQVPRDKSLIDASHSTQEPLPSPANNSTQKSERNARRLFVRNIPFETYWQDLKSLFQEAGTVETVVKQQRTSRGSAFVYMSTVEEARKAVRLLDGREFGGKSIQVELYEPGIGKENGSVPLAQCRLHIRNLPSGYGQKDLRTLFGEAGKVGQVYIATNPNKEKYAYVTMGNLEEAKRAVRLLNGRSIKGMTVEVFLEEGEKDQDVKDVGVGDQVLPEPILKTANTIRDKFLDDDVAVKSPPQTPPSSSIQTKSKSQPTPKQAEQPRRLFIQNLPSTYTAHELKSLFSEAGKPGKVYIATNKNNPRKYGYVTMGSSEEVRRAVRLLDGWRGIKVLVAGERGGKQLAEEPSVEGERKTEIDVGNGRAGPCLSNVKNVNREPQTNLEPISDMETEKDAITLSPPSTRNGFKSRNDSFSSNHLTQEPVPQSTTTTPKPNHPPSRVLRVNNLSLYTTQAELRYTFQEAGTVENAYVVIDGTGYSLRHGFVWMKTVEEAVKARELDGRVVRDRKMGVRFCVPEKTWVAEKEKEKEHEREVLIGEKDDKSGSKMGNVTGHEALAQLLEGWDMQDEDLESDEGGWMRDVKGRLEGFGSREGMESERGEEKVFWNEDDMEKKKKDDDDGDCGRNVGVNVQIIAASPSESDIPPSDHAKDDVKEMNRLGVDASPSPPPQSNKPNQKEGAYYPTLDEWTTPNQQEVGYEPYYPSTTTVPLATILAQTEIARWKEREVASDDDDDLDEEVGRIRVNEGVWGDSAVVGVRER